MRQKYPQPFTQEVTENILIQRHFQKTAANDPVLQEFMRSRNMGFSFYGNSIEAGYIHIKKVCYSIFYPTLSKTPPERRMPDVMHWTLNVVGGDFVAFVLEHAQQMGPEKVKLLLRRLKFFGGKKPITGYDADASIALMRTVREWVPAVQVFRTIRVIRIYWSWLCAYPVSETFYWNVSNPMTL